VVIGDYLENADYKALSDPDKAIHMWTSKFHKHLNAILRDHSFESIMTRTKWTKAYVLDLLKYYKSRAVDKNTLK